MKIEPSTKIEVCPALLTERHFNTRWWCFRKSFLEMMEFKIEPLRVMSQLKQGRKVIPYMRSHGQLCICRDLQEGNELQMPWNTRPGVGGHF